MKGKEKPTLDLNPLLEVAKADKRAFKSLKNAAVSCHAYELASKLREIELELFPESEELKQAKKEIIEWQTAFRMVDLNIEDSTAYLIVKTVLMFQEKKGDFTLLDALEIQSKKVYLFEQLSL